MKMDFTVYNIPCDDTHDYSKFKKKNGNVSVVGWGDNKII